MPIDLHSSLKGASQWAFGSPLLNSVLGSSIFVAFVIALLMVLSIMFMYPAKAGTPFSVLAKLFVYMFFGTMLIVFLHDGVIKYIIEEEYTEKDNEYFMQNTTLEGRRADPSYSGMYKIVSPLAPVAPVAQAPQVIPQPPPSLPGTATDTVSGGGYLTSMKPPNKYVTGRFA